MKRFEPLSEPTTPRKARQALTAAFEALEQAAYNVARAPSAHHRERLRQAAYAFVQQSDRYARCWRDAPRAYPDPDGLAMRLSPLPLRSDAQPYGVALQTVRDLVRLEQSARTYETRLRIAQDPHIPRSALAQDAFGYVVWTDANVRLAERMRGTRDASPLASDMWRMNERTIVDPFLIASSMWRAWLAAQLAGDVWILALYEGADLRMVWEVEPPPEGEGHGWRLGKGDDEAHLPEEMERLVAARIALWPRHDAIAIAEGKELQP